MAELREGMPLLFRRTAPHAISRQHGHAQLAQPPKGSRAKLQPTTQELVLSSVMHLRSPSAPKQTAFFASQPSRARALFYNFHNLALLGIILDTFSTVARLLGSPCCVGRTFSSSGVISAAWPASVSTSPVG